MNDLELEQAALEACGYRVHVKERNGTRWLTACKGLEVRYVHWHPLTNINQAMQLLIDVDFDIYVKAYRRAACAGIMGYGQNTLLTGYITANTAQALIAAQCRAIVTACANR